VEATTPAEAVGATDKLTYKLTYQQGQAAGTSTQRAAAPAFLLGPFIIIIQNCG